MMSTFMGSARETQIAAVRDDIAGYSGEVVSAMKVLEPLLRSGLLALHPDEWQGGKLSFLRPAQARRQGWTPPDQAACNQVSGSA